MPMGHMVIFSVTSLLEISAHALSDAEALAVPTWHPNMLWYGPGGIGSTGLTISRYQKQHQVPFRNGLYDKETV